MTLSRRVAKLEEALSPTQLVLRWLAEAHAYGDIPPYVASLLAQDPPVRPLDRLAREAVHGARTAMRGKRPELVEPAVRSALRETVFRYELVLRINVTAHDLVDREGLSTRPSRPRSPWSPPRRGASPRTSGGWDNSVICSYPGWTSFTWPSRHV